MKVCQVWYAVTKKPQTVLHIACEDLARKLALVQLSHILSPLMSYHFLLMMRAWIDKDAELFLKVFVFQLSIRSHPLLPFSYTF